VTTQRVRVSVIVPLYNNPGQAAECLGAIGAPRGPEMEVIAVDDGSTDGTPAIAQAAGARLVRLERNSGPAAARNAGAQAASGEVLLFVDQDVVVPPGVIDRVARTMEQRPELAALFGSYDAAPRAPGIVSQFRNLLHHYVHQQGDPEASTFWAGCGAVRREVFQSLGGFDPSQTLEDVELGYRLRRHGHRILLDRELQVKHLKAWTLRSMIRTDIAFRAIPWARLILTTGTAPVALNLRTPQRWSVALTGVALALAVLSPLAPILLLPAGVLVAAIIALNAGFYRFLLKVRGLGFAAAAVPLHLIHFACSGAGAAWALLGGRGASRVEHA
jgi:GT2 family glycosyltransferase